MIQRESIPEGIFANQDFVLGVYLSLLRCSSRNCQPKRKIKVNQVLNVVFLYGAVSNVVDPIGQLGYDFQS